MKHEIWMVLFIHKPEAVEQIKTAIITTTEAEMTFPAGELRVSRAALGKLGFAGVAAAFEDHLAGRWWNADEDERAENSIAARNGDVIANVDRTRGIACFTFRGYTLLTDTEADFFIADTARR